jgi:hypothetical protein
MRSTSKPWSSRNKRRLTRIRRLNRRCFILPTSCSMKMTSTIKTSTQQTVIEVTRGRRPMMKIPPPQMIKTTRTPSDLSSLQLQRSCRNPRQRPPSKRMMMRTMMETSTLTSLLRRTKLMTLVWTINSKMMKSASKGSKSRTLRRSRSLSNSLKGLKSISRTTSKRVSSSSNNVRAVGEAAEGATRAETSKTGAITIGEMTISRGMRGLSNNILLKQEIGLLISLDRMTVNIMIAKETQREAMEKIEVEKVNISLAGVTEVAVATLTTIGEVREVETEVVASINNVVEAEAIAITTNVKVAKTVIITTPPPTPLKAMILIIIMITATKLNQSNRITNLPPSTNLEVHLNNIIMIKSMVMRKTQLTVAVEEEAVTKDMAVTEAEEVEVVEAQGEVGSMTRNHKALKRLVATDLSN